MGEENMQMGKNLRTRGGGEAHVTTAELFFDLIYAFAVTQLSHRIVHDLTVTGLLETLVLWFAVWLGWQYTCWVTNWFDPERIQVRLLLFGTMLLGLGSSIALPEAFDGLGKMFAFCYAAMQVFRSAVALSFLGLNNPLSKNYQRILGWTCISAVFWVVGALLPRDVRLLVWAIAVACEYVSPMMGFVLPFLGRSRASDWKSADGRHIAERCEAFVLIALGESLLASGGTVSELHAWSIPVFVALLAGFVGSLAMWWVYFDTTNRAASRAIAKAEQPGKMAAHFHYVHVLLIAGIIVVAAGDDLAIVHPDRRNTLLSALVLVGGPALFILGNVAYKFVIYRRAPLSHLVGLGALAGVAMGSLWTDHLMASGLTTVILVAVAGWETSSNRKAIQRRSGQS
jgi:low temperature requirement protein LtrA